MKLKKEEYASSGDGRLMKTVMIEFEPEDEHDEKIIEKFGKSHYFGEPF